MGRPKKQLPALHALPAQAQGFSAMETPSEIVARVGKEEVQTDPQLLQANRRNELELASIQADILAMRVKNRRSNTAATYRNGQKLWSVGLHLHALYLPEECLH